jgi:hypothetical protein
MADRVRRVSYAYVTVPNRAGQGEKILRELREAEVNMLAFSAFPAKAGKAQMDIVAENMAAVRRVAKRNDWRLSKIKKGILVQGKDEVGAVHRHVRKLAAGKVNVTAADAIFAGKGRYGLILWVKPKDYARAARLLKAK